MKITCAKCQRVFSPTAGAQARKFKSYTEYGIECPRCAEWTTAYFLTPALEVEQRRLQVRQQRHQSEQTEASWEHYQWQLSAYQRAYESVQRRIKRKRGESELVRGQA